MRVLVVDDDQVVLNSCRRILESSVHDVRTTSSVHDAMEVLDEYPADLILVDIKMPKEDGLSLIRRIKNRGDPVPILVMSGYPTSDTISTSLKTGATAFLPKPFTPDELLQAIDSVFENETEGETNGKHEDPGN